jgi:hypothetical protein
VWKKLAGASNENCPAETSNPPISCRRKGVDVVDTCIRRIIGYDDRDLPLAFFTHPGNSVDVVDGQNLTGIFSAFVHAPFKLIFYSANPQAIECTWKSAPTKRLGTTFRMISRDWDQGSVT